MIGTENGGVTSSSSNNGMPTKGLNQQLVFSAQYNDVGVTNKHSTPSHDQKASFRKLVQLPPLEYLLFNRNRWLLEVIRLAENEKA